MTTIKDVAKLAGVAPSSVTRVLNGHPHVSESLAARVYKAVDDLGYRPDLVAAGLRRGTSQTVGILVSDIINPSLAQFVDGLETILRDHGYGVLLANSHGDPDRDVESVELLRQRRIDGMVVMCVDERSTALRQALGSWGGPIVLVDRQVEGLTDASAVLSDHRRGAFNLTTHLLDLGHRRIGYLGGLTGTTYVWHERVAGLTQALEAHGLHSDTRGIKAARATADNASHATAELLDSDEPPTAIVVGPSPMLAGVLIELGSRGLRVGEDIALACLDEPPIAPLHRPAITAVRRHIDEVARTAADLLLAQLNGDGRHFRTVVLPVELVLRDSTEKYPVRPAPAGPRTRGKTTQAAGSR
jgi:DNA-binding LacI/PurR family transcriptional regulator